MTCLTTWAHPDSLDYLGPQSCSVLDIQHPCKIVNPCNIFHVTFFALSLSWGEGSTAFNKVADRYQRVHLSLVSLTKWRGVFHTKFPGVTTLLVCSNLCDVRSNCDLWTLPSTDCAPRDSTQDTNSPVVTAAELQAVSSAPGWSKTLKGWKLPAYHIFQRLSPWYGSYHRYTELRSSIEKKSLSAILGTFRGEFAIKE